MHQLIVVVLEFEGRLCALVQITVRWRNNPVPDRRPQAKIPPVAQAHKRLRDKA
jgi:hypothetical protein